MKTRYLILLVLAVVALAALLAGWTWSDDGVAAAASWAS